MYRIASLNGRPFAELTTLSITTPTGDTVELRVRYRHQPDSAIRKAAEGGKPAQYLGDDEIYQRTVCEVHGISGEDGTPLDPAAAVEALRAAGDDWLISIIAVGYMRARAEAMGNAFAPSSARSTGAASASSGPAAN